MRFTSGGNILPRTELKYLGIFARRCDRLAYHAPLRRAATLSFRALDEKWQKKWAEAQGLRQSSPKAKVYILAMFPYPSGALHMGHVRVYTIADVLTRFRRMHGHSTGEDVIYPMGWDAFGLPAENAAIERGLDPAEWTRTNIAKMKEQLRGMNTDIDWSRELITCKSEFYKHTQRIFLWLYEQGLAYQAQSIVNFDPVDRTVLANEQVDSNGFSWRSGAKVEKVSLTQWFLRITAFKEELLEDLKLLTKWPERVKSMQQNWLGKSSGTRLTFDISSEIKNAPASVSVYTTRLDTLFGVQFLALSASHPLAIEHAKSDSKLQKFIDGLSNLPEGSKVGYKIKGAIAWNPLKQVSNVPDSTQKDLPIWVTPYVKAEYGEGAVMGVPAHDERDFAFWKANCGEESVRKVIQAGVPDQGEMQFANEVFKDPGQLNEACGTYAGLSSEAAAERMLQDLKQNDADISKVETWRLRDWLISRQRYWGTPIPMIHCKSCGPVPVPVADLPVKLPKLDSAVFKYGKGNPLEQAEHWINVKCPQCSQPAKRDTDTMDTFVDSSWYMFRFADPCNDKLPFAPESANTYMPVDTYVGGIEHAILHLLYARFIGKFLTKAGLWPSGALPEVKGEPFKQLISQGMVHGKTFRDPKNGQFLKPDELDLQNPSKPLIKRTGEEPVVSFEKMSKSKYNGVDPTTFIAEYGADITRVHMLFQAPVSEILEWEEARIVGVQRWMTRLYKFVESASHSLLNTTSAENPVIAGKTLDSLKISSLDRQHAELYLKTEQTVKSITTALSETQSLNTCISDLMTLTNDLLSVPDSLPSNLLYHITNTLIRLMGPFAPAFAEECWEMLHTGHSTTSQEIPSLFEQPWPIAENLDALEAWAKQSLKVPCAVMENGKLRMVVDIMPVPDELSEDERQNWVQSQIGNDEKCRQWLNAKESSGVKWKRVVVVKSGQTVNFVGSAPSK